MSDLLPAGSQMVRWPHRRPPFCAPAKSVRFLNNVILFVCLLSMYEAIAEPLGGDNLIAGSDAVDQSPWELAGGAVFDSGTGAIIFPIPNSGSLRSAFIRVSHEHDYWLSGFMKSERLPVYLYLVIAEYSENKQFLRNRMESRWGNSADGIWEEIGYAYQPTYDTSFVKVSINRMESPDPSAKAWVNSLNFSIGSVALKAPPAPKALFDGAQVKVDAVGNVSVLREGSYVHFFPLCIFADNDRPLSFYSAAGWNCNMWASDAAKIQEGKNAVSELNPYGMMSALQIAGFMIKSHPEYRNLTLLKQRMAAIESSGASTHLLAYYWDNENNQTEWVAPFEIVGAIKTFESRLGRGRRVPVYVLQGMYGVARTYAAAGLGDIVGTYYLGDDAEVGAGKGATGLRLIQEAQGQKSPLVFAQINRVTAAGEFRVRAFAAIAQGAKGIGYWRDCYSQACKNKWGNTLRPIEEMPWWVDIPLLRSEIDRLMPIIRANHRPNWSASVLGSNSVVVGVREANSNRYLILANLGSQDAEVRIKLLGLEGNEYEKLVDLITGATIGSFATKDEVQVTIPGMGASAGVQVLQLLGQKSAIRVGPSPPTSVDVN